MKIDLNYILLNFGGVILILAIITPILILAITITNFGIISQLDKIIKRLDKLNENDKKIE